MSVKERFNAYKNMNLNLNMQRGQPSNADFDLSNDLLSAVSKDNTLSSSGVELRNYGGGIYGLIEARELFAEVLGVSAEQVLVGNNASLELQSHVLSWALLRGLAASDTPWVRQNPKMIVATPGYDRHFLLLQKLGFELVTVDMTSDGPDINAVEALVATDASIKGILFVPTYSNPTGDSLSETNAKRLASMETAAKDFTIFADDAYRVHHLFEPFDEPVNLINACQEAGNPDRVYVFSSTSKITYSGSGLGYMATSNANLDYIAPLLSAQSIGPNKLEQQRHVTFLRNYAGGIAGLMREHAKIIAPKFQAVYDVFERELAGANLATWTTPQGGYFISLDTVKPVAKRVVELAKEAGVSLTPAGATYVNGIDPSDKNIRLAPTRPPGEDVKLAMEVVAICIKLASQED